MREEQVVLEDKAHGPPFGRQEPALVRVVEHGAIQHQPAAVQRLKARQHPQQRGLARAVGAEHRQHLTRLCGQLDVQVETSELEPRRDLEAHRAAR